MKEILFRGKKTGSPFWIYGDLHRDINRTTILTYSPECLLGYEVEPATVGQYIGQMDINGKKLFEGDIVKHKDLIYEIAYLEKYTRFAPRRKGVIFAGFLLSRSERIGNKFDNPELLEVD